MFNELLYFIGMAVAGGFCYVLIASNNWDNLYTFTSIRHVIISLIVGVIYYILYSDYSYPNMVMSFVSGYMGPSFIQQLSERLRQPVEKEKTTVD